MNKKKLFEKIQRSSNNIRFSDVVLIVEAFGFHLSRINGSHHIFINPQVRAVVNLQEENGKAKYYQVQQFLRIVERHNLTLGE